jgi:hypothetical protein
MSRRSTPEPLDDARRAATRRRLTLAGLSEATAEAWIGAWDAQAARDGLQRDGDYWDAAWAWIAEERRQRR